MKKKYFITGVLFVVITMQCGYLIMMRSSTRDVDITGMSPREIVDFYLKLREENSSEVLKKIVTFPNDVTRVNNLMASDAEKDLYSAGTKRKTIYERIIDSDTAEVGIVLIMAGKIIPLQQMMLKRDGDIWKLDGAKWDNYSKEQFHEMLKNSPSDPDIYYYLGKQYSTERFVRAADYYTKYLKLSDNKFWNGPDMQVLLEQGKEIDAFIAKYKPQVDANPLLPRNDTLCAKLALAYIDKGDAVNAEKYLNIMEKILELSPNKYMREKYNQVKKEFDLFSKKSALPENE